MIRQPTELEQPWDGIADCARQERASEDCVKSIREVLNSLERMAIGIRIEVYDENILFNSYGTYEGNEGSCNYQ